MLTLSTLLFLQKTNAFTWVSSAQASVVLPRRAVSSRGLTYMTGIGRDDYPVRAMTVHQFGSILSSASTRRLYQIVDVRESSEVEVASIAGNDMINLPLGCANEWSQDVKEGKILDKSKPTICLCKVGVRSMRMATFLSQSGYEEVYNVEGGINLYSTEIDPKIPLY